jgi:hypothetical protein
MAKGEPVGGGGIGLGVGVEAGVGVGVAGGVGVGVGLALARRGGVVARRRLDTASIDVPAIANNLTEPNFISYFLSVSAE